MGTYAARRKTESIQLDSVEFSALGFKGKWVADRAQQTAAWEMYVELVTRIAVQDLAADGGLLREALSSLHALFDTTREILRKYGPGVARPQSKGDTSFGAIAVKVLNHHLRPFLTKWHPELQAYESTRNGQTSPAQHERAWERALELRGELRAVQEAMKVYAAILAAAAAIDPVH